MSDRRARGGTAGERAPHEGAGQGGRQRDAARRRGTSRVFGAGLAPIPGGAAPLPAARAQPEPDGRARAARRPGGAAARFLPIQELAASPAGRSRSAAAHPLRHPEPRRHGARAPGAASFLPTKAPRGLRLLLLSLPLILGGIARAARYLFRLERLPRAARGGSRAASPTTPRGRGPDPGPTPPAPGGAGRCSRGSPEGPRRAAGGTRLRLPVPPRDGPGVNVSFLTG